MTLPFRQFVLKLHGRCNLACDHCYVYEMADQRWRTRPRAMAPEIAERTAERIGEHARTWGLASVDVVLHGGEPLLAGEAAIRHVVGAVRDRVPARVSVQTNGTLLDQRFADLFTELGIRVSVSVDGDEQAHDRHRVRPDGTGSFAGVRRGVDLLRGRSCYGGLLCTVDLRNDPVHTYEALLGLAPPMIDFLLPHGNWSAPPPGRTADAGRAPYGEWLAAAFDRWYSAPRRETGVRIFEELITVLFGGASTVEGIGLSPALMVVVETDGTIEQSDILASAFEGAGSTGLDVRTASFDEVLALPEIRARQAGAAGLSATCQECRLHRVCGGGLRAHRYREGEGFDHPSVYCPDLKHLIRHVRARLTRDLAAIR
ncbi:FxsB family cyclophane-forming radical SAM/SPASM peptide maturase [Lentzea sp. CA-135723]|uniref:FxsB family cyclophane-forming radical SAM/SPASM peptide maturase n=1 Tax=Lentzea sp. CA-135723 TaxID=3239950 RepID=UPI003D8ABB4D